MTTPVETDPAERWRALLRVALIVLIAVAALIIFYVQFPIPPLVLFIVVFGVVLYLLTREGRARTVGTWIGGIGALLFLLFNLPFVIEDIQHPDSALAFIATGAGIVGSIVGFVAMLGALLHWGIAPIRAILAVGVAAVALVVLVGAIGKLSTSSDDREDGDVVLVADDADFLAEDNEDADREDPAELTVDESGAVFVDNKDLYRHTFVIEELDIEQEVPEATDRRIEIDAEPGEYVFICDVPDHEDDMSGTLTVE